MIVFKKKFDLCLDRSNWKFGNKDINYLVLSWRIRKKISIPLMFIEFDKAGNSNTQERIDLLEDFNEIFGFNRIKSLMADREFIGKQWFRMLDNNKIPYFIRIKENTLLPWVLINFQRCIAQSLTDTIETIFNLLERAKNVLF